jgi:hypothetical protein
LHKDVAGNLQNKLIGYTDDVDLQRIGRRARHDEGAAHQLKLLETHTFYAYGPAISRAPVLTGRCRRRRRRHRAARTGRGAAARAAVQKILAQLVDLPKEAEEEARTVQDLQRRNADLERRIRQAEKGMATKTVEKPVVDQAAIDRAVKAATTPLRRALEAAVKFIIKGQYPELRRRRRRQGGARARRLRAVSQGHGMVEQRLESAQIEQLRAKPVSSTH